MQVERQVLFWLLAAVGVIFLIGLLQEILLPFVAGMVIAYMFNPLADRLERLGFNRILASALIVVLAAAAFVTALVFLVPLVFAQAQQFAAALPGELQRLETLLEAWARDQFGDNYPQLQNSISKAVNSVSENWESLAGWLAASLWSQGAAVFNFISFVLVTPIVVFYLLVDWNDIVAKIDGWLPRAHAPRLRRLGEEINAAVSAFIRGQGTVCVILGLLYAAGLSLVGLEYGLFIGLATGVMAFVPIVGWVLGTVTATTLAVLQFWPEVLPVILVLCVFLAGQALDASFLGPKVVGPKIGLHPVWLIFALFSFSYLFGLVGTLVAVPMAAAIGVLVRFLLDAYLKSDVYSGGAVPPAGDGAGQ